MTTTMRFTIACLLLLSLLLQPTAVSAQNYNDILDEDIRTVQLYIAGAPLIHPIAALNAPNGNLVLVFDHLGTDLKDYLYTLEHCDADWQPSKLNDNEYIDGYTEDRILTYESSINTLVPYVHFRLALPNPNMRWTKSGNYLLKIYDNDNDRALVLVRRFMVVEPVQWSVSGNFVKPVQVEKLNTHQEIDFFVKHKGSIISNPQSDVKAYVLQNGRWDNFIGPVKPYIERGEQLDFDYQDKIVFPAGKEWRTFDMRTFDYSGEWVKKIYERDDFYEVTLRTDEDRSGLSYLYKGDINGRYSIGTVNQNQESLQYDYARVMFSIEQNIPLEDEEVYVFGELSDWQLKPEFKMKYFDEGRVYYCEALLKQGFYNYEYAVVKRGSNVIEEDGFEGNWYLTGNTYTILVYYKPFGQRYERLMCTKTLDSKQ